MTTIKGFKAFDKDLKCRGFQFELGKDFTTDMPKEKLKTCEAGGFHFCRSLNDVYDFYPFGSVVAEVEAFGDVVDDSDGKKSVTNGLRLLRILCAETEARANTNSSSTGYLNTGDLNTGHWNTGHWNTGHWNTGHRNTGHWNTGHWNTGHRNTGHRNTGDLNTGDWNTGDLNTGDWNTGDWNTGHWNTGYFNTVTPDDVLVFNKLCPRAVWEKAEKPSWIFFDIVLWIEFSNMTEEEKEKYPTAKTTGGYLKQLDYKEAWKRAYDNASPKEREKVKLLPNFDAAVFKEISGLDLN